MKKITSFEKEKSYLVEGGAILKPMLRGRGKIMKMTVLEITETSIKVKWENGFLEWIRKSEFLFERATPEDNVIIECIEG